MFLENLKKQLHQNQSLFIGEDTAFRSAVLIPLVQKDGEWHILFEVRSMSMRKQPGDISFPGGRIDETDASPLAAAVRETAEELGVHPQSVQVVGELSPYIFSSTFVTYPFVAVVEQQQIVPGFNKDEVEEVFTVPLNWLLQYEPYMHEVAVEIAPLPDFPFHKIVNGAQYKWRKRFIEEWFYDYEHYTIWGLTARILKQFIDSIKQNQEEF